MIALLEKDPEVLKQRLPKANMTRSQRALMKSSLKSGKLKASTVVEKSPWWVKTMKVYQLLVHTPYVGTDADTKTIGKMTARQQEDLLAYLRELEKTTKPTAEP
jgi:hypothetical protein